MRACQDIAAMSHKITYIVNSPEWWLNESSAQYTQCVVCRSYTRSTKYCVERVCVSVCSHIAKTTRPNLMHQFVHILPMAVAQSHCGGVAIRYVLQVSWITSCFHIIIVIRVAYIGLAGDHSRRASQWNWSPRRSPTNMATAKIAAVDFKKWRQNDVTLPACLRPCLLWKIS